MYKIFEIHLNSMFAGNGNCLDCTLSTARSTTESLDGTKSTPAQCMFFACITNAILLQMLLGYSEVI